MGKELAHNRKPKRTMFRAHIFLRANLAQKTWEAKNKKGTNTSNLHVCNGRAAVLSSRYFTDPTYNVRVQNNSNQLPECQWICPWTQTIRTFSERKKDQRLQYYCKGNVISNYWAVYSKMKHITGKCKPNSSFFEQTGRLLKHKHDAIILVQKDDLQVYNKQMIYKA